eukprot:g23697.t1
MSGQVLTGQVVDWKGKYGWIQPAELIRHEKVGVALPAAAHGCAMAAARLFQQLEPHVLHVPKTPSAFKLEEISYTPPKTEKPPEPRSKYEVPPEDDAPPHGQKMKCDKGIDFAQTCPIGWTYVPKGLNVPSKVTERPDVVARMHQKREIFLQEIAAAWTPMIESFWLPYFLLVNYYAFGCLDQVPCFLSGAIAVPALRQDAGESIQLIFMIIAEVFFISIMALILSTLYEKEYQLAAASLELEEKVEEVKQAERSGVAAQRLLAEFVEESAKAIAPPRSIHLQMRDSGGISFNAELFHVSENSERALHQADELPSVENIQSLPSDMRHILGYKLPQTRRAEQPSLNRSSSESDGRNPDATPVRPRDCGKMFDSKYFNQ